VTKKVVEGLVDIKLGKKEKIFLGNLDAKRDWGYARDYVRAMWMMLQKDMPDDYVVATGETHTVRELVEYTGALLGYDIVWEGNGDKEVGKDKNSGKVLIEIDPIYYRPAEVDLLLGDATKAKEKLGWEPEYKFKELIKLMVEDEIKNKK
jgi:GDPmannose 4,6-dehydratase